MECIHCGSLKYVKNGSYKGVQRYYCKTCFLYFSNKVRKFSYKYKERAIYTDGNNMYKRAFSYLGISDLHIVAVGKSEIHMIEATNSSIRDNLARFNRNSK